MGKPLMVDSATSGYSYLLQYVLSIFGLTFIDGDFGFQVVRGTATRYSYLIGGTLPDETDVYATILTYPVTIKGESLPLGQALNILARILNYIAPITSSSFMVRGSSLSNRTQYAVLTRFLASVHAANRFLHNTRNANCSIAAIAAQLGFGRRKTDRLCDKGCCGEIVREGRSGLEWELF